MESLKREGNKEKKYFFLLFLLAFLIFLLFFLREGHAYASFGGAIPFPFDRGKG